MSNYYIFFLVVFLFSSCIQDKVPCEEYRYNNTKLNDLFVEKRYPQTDIVIRIPNTWMELEFESDGHESIYFADSLLYIESGVVNSITITSSSHQSKKKIVPEDILLGNDTQITEAGKFQTNGIDFVWKRGYDSTLSYLSLAFVNRKKLLIANLSASTDESICSIFPYAIPHKIEQ